MKCNSYKYNPFNEKALLMKSEIKPEIKPEMKYKMKFSLFGLFLNFLYLNTAF